MKTLSALAEEVIKALETATPEERMWFWGEVEYQYCTYCGNIDPDNRCQCWNDE